MRRGHPGEIAWDIARDMGALDPEMIEQRDEPLGCRMDRGRPARIRPRWPRSISLVHATTPAARKSEISRSL